MRLLLGTGNADKIAEYRDLLAGLPLTLVLPGELDPVPADPPEDAPTYRENAVAKALAYARASGLPAVADDSGLEVEALHGATGVRSRRYFGDVSSEERNAKLLALLDGAAGRAARFVCVIALADPQGATAVFEGTVRGAIAAEPRGVHGFGYDPVFVVLDGPRTMAELSPAEKHRVSHRGRAAALLRAHLVSYHS